MCISQASKILCASILSPIMMWDQSTQHIVRARFLEKDEIMLGFQVEKFWKVLLSYLSSSPSGNHTEISNHFSLRNFMWFGIPSLVKLSVVGIKASSVVKSKPIPSHSVVRLANKLCANEERWEFIRRSWFSKLIRLIFVCLIRYLLRHLAGPGLKTEPRVMVEKADLFLLQMCINDWEPVISHRNWCSLLSISSVKQHFFTAAFSS